MHTDPIADLLTRIRNAERADLLALRVPYSRIKHEICQLLEKEGYLKDVQQVTDEKFPQLQIALLVDRKRPMNLRRVSKPGQRIYQGYKAIKPVLNKLGIAIVSTSQGLMTDVQARKKKLGGELLCEIY